MSFLLESGAAARSYPSLNCCGDATVIAEDGGVQLFAVVDALGHGPDAEKSAKAVSEVLQRQTRAPLRELFGGCDRALEGLRNVVMAVIRVEGSRAQFAGVGNIELYPPAGVSRPSVVAGTVGRGTPNLRIADVSFESGQRWVMVSDGLHARKMPVALQKVSQLMPERAARELLTLAARPDDDASALVLDVRGPR